MVTPLSCRFELDPGPGTTTQAVDAATARAALAMTERGYRLRLRGVYDRTPAGWDCRVDAPDGTPVATCSITTLLHLGAATERLIAAATDVVERAASKPP